MKTKFTVTGMTCSACAAHIEKAVRKLTGVRRADVNLLLGTMEAEYDGITADDIINEVERAGYGAREADGVIMLNLCWNRDNALCGAAMGSGSGLTEQGRGFVRECQRLGVAVDMSHASERAFWDALELSEKPMIASHSNSAALCSAFPRNLTDAQFGALAKTGGGAGINLCPDFLAEGGAGMADVLRHIEHFLALGGERAVFLGADFDGIDATPEGLRGAQDMGALYEALLRENYPEALVRGIFYENLLNILERTQ